MSNAEFWSTDNQGRGYCAKAWNPWGYSYFRLTWGAPASELGYVVPGNCPGSEVAIFHTLSEAEKIADAWESRGVA